MVLSLVRKIVNSRLQFSFNELDDENTDIFKATVTHADLSRRFVSQCHCDTNRALGYTRRLVWANFINALRENFKQQSKWRDI